MKKIIIVLVIVLVSNFTFSQTQKPKSSKMQDFVSKKGVIVKYENFNLPKIKSTYSNCESKIRRVIIGNQVKYFLLLSKKSKYNSVTSAIAYEDIIEIQKTLIALKSKSLEDILTKADYLENQFITDDELVIGYYISKNEVVWCIKLDSSNDSTLFFKTQEPLINAFRLGKEKIDFLKQE